jgi:uncharacterized membrane protein
MAKIITLVTALFLITSSALADAGGSGGWQGMMGSGWSGGMFGFGVLGIISHLFFWIAFVTLTVFIARKVWNATDNKKK